jgi:peptidoglycan/xylan/chitin deacetylase (PgdA/CDA1 family)
MDKDYLSAFPSEFIHYVAFSCKRPLSQFDAASLIVSIDVDVGSPELGLKNRGRNDRNVKRALALTEHAVGKIEEQVVPLLLKVFDELELPVTFALRGQLTEIENSIINLILESNTRHEIAAHGYSHKVFTEMSGDEAEGELRRVSTGMNKFGITPRSFVFPKNQISYLRLLERYGYLCYRGWGNFLMDGMYVRKCGNLFDIHPSLFLQFYNSIFSKKIIDLAVKYRAPIHVWFHPCDVLFWNVRNSPEVAAERITKVLLPLIEHARKKKNQGLLKFETMLSITEEYQRIEKIHKAK